MEATTKDIKTRVVITGMGVVSPLGSHTDLMWENLMSGQSGISPLTRFDTTNIPSKIAGMIPSEGINSLDPDEFVEKKSQRVMDRFILLGMVAAHKALVSANWKPETLEQKQRTGVIVGSGIGGLPKIEDTVRTLISKGPHRVSPFFVPSTLINLISGHLSVAYGFLGPNFAVASACAAGGHSIGEAYKMIQRGNADVMLAGGAEAAICATSVAGFAQMKALSTKYNTTPEKASRPWDKGRDGFVIGEGAGILVLEKYEHALARGAKIHAEIVGYGLSSDGYHMTTPDPESKGAIHSMQCALRSADLQPEDIGYINAHGTSTPLGDAGELQAVQKVFKHDIAMSSTKSSMGHLLGASGAVEAIISILSLIHQKAPPTLNLDEPDCDLKNVDLLPHKPKSLNILYALSNSFGFGSTNCSLIFKKV